MWAGSNRNEALEAFLEQSLARAARAAKQGGLKAARATQQHPARLAQHDTRGGRRGRSRRSTSTSMRYGTTLLS